MSRPKASRMDLAQRAFATAALLSAALTIAGCLGGPRLHPQFVGIGDLAEGNPDVAPHSSALDLPKVDACPPGAGAECSAWSQRPAYTVGPFDQLNVLVWGRGDLGSQMPPPDPGGSGGRVSEVQQDGTISLPFLGSVPVAGKTVSEIRDLVQGRYSEIVEGPQVDVQLSACRSRRVSLEGEVAKPGVYPLCLDRLTVAEVLASAGGLGQRADPGRGTLLRQGAPFALDYRTPELGAGGVVLEDGDVLHFPATGQRMVYVFGEVRRQGAYPIPPEGMDILHALGQAGGFGETAMTRRFFLVRPQGSAAPQVYQLDFGRVMEAPSVALADGDRLFMPPTALSRWNSFWRQALPVGIYNVSFRQSDILE